MKQDVGIADQQKVRKQGRDDSIKLFSIQPYLTYMYLPTLKTCSYIGCLQDANTITVMVM